MRTLETDEGKSGEHNGKKIIIGDGSRGFVMNRYRHHHIEDLHNAGWLRGSARGGGETKASSKGSSEEV